MLRRMVNFFRGSVLVEVAGPFPERFLNLCAAEEVGFWAIRWQDSNTVRLKLTPGGAKLAPALAQRVQCGLTVVRRAGLPALLWGLRRRYGLLAGLALSLLTVCVLSQFVLTVEVEGNVAVPTSRILSELRRQGVKPGAFGPAIDERQVSHEILLEIPELSWLAVNLHGVRAQVLVREAEPKPDIEDESAHADIVADAGGLIVHVEVTRGRVLVAEGDTVAPGDTLITGTVDLKEPDYGTVDLGTMTVRAGGRVVARTWRTLTAQIPLEAPVKVYTGEETTRLTLNLFGKELNFYRNGSISYAGYDKIRETDSLTLPGGLALPLSLTRETIRAYTTQLTPLNDEQAEALLCDALLERLEALIGEEGEVVGADYSAAVADGLLTVTLTAECREEIGKTVEF